MTMTELEQRVATLEQQLSNLAKKVHAAPSADMNAWIDRIHGTFQNDAAYRKAARLSSQWRKSQRPAASRARKASSK